MNSPITKLQKWHLTTSTTWPWITALQNKFPTAKVYLVGGAVRDIILDRPTTDYDFVVTNVPANQLEKFLATGGEVNLVGKSFGVFKFKPTTNPDETLDIALPRTEQAGMSGGYRDFTVQSDPELSIEADLERRDFTINAMAWDMIDQKLIDPFAGQSDLEKKIIRAIGDPVIRFQEDYTRMLRAIRFACQLDFTIEKITFATIKLKADTIKTIADERVNDEFSKIILSPRPDAGIILLKDSGILAYLVPELTAAAGVGQNKAHIYDVFDHLVRSLAVAAQYDTRLEIRLAALFHDIGKPATKEGDGKDSTFYNHDVVGAKMTKAILTRLKYPHDVIKYVTHLVRYHMFFYALDTVSDAGVRRLLNRLGKENIDDFIQLRICDRLGMGRPKAKPWKLVQLERRLKEVQLEPIAPKMLQIDGLQVMELLKIKPSRRVGDLLNALLGDILEHPDHNTPEYLEKKLIELNKLSDEELNNLHPDVAYYEEERKRLLHQTK